MNWENLAAIGKEKLLDAMHLEERRSGASKFFATLGVFAAGAIVGGAVALLLTPKSGEDLRKDITDKFTELTGIGKDGEKEETAGAGGNSRMGATGASRTASSTSRPTGSV